MGLVDADVTAVGLARVDADAPFEPVAGLPRLLRQRPVAVLVDALPKIEAEVASRGGHVEDEDPAGDERVVHATGHGLGRGQPGA